MGNLNASIGYVVNEDGSITRTNRATSNFSHSPDFIPISMSKVHAPFWRRLVFLLGFFGIAFIHYSCIVWFILGIKESGYSSLGEILLIASGGALLVCVCLDIFALPRLFKNFPRKKKYLKNVEYIQANLMVNNGFPYIMTANKIGVFNTHTAKIIIPTKYDDIRWVVAKHVLCAEENGKKTFYDSKGNVLQNVPQSYYSF